MSLRKQLLAFAALTLILPWAGFQFVRQMEAALQGAFEGTLVATAGTIAEAIEDHPAIGIAADNARPGTDARPVYAHRLAAAPRVDGARDDWSVGQESAQSLSGSHFYTAGISGSFVYLFVEVTDEDLVYQRTPGQAPYGDRLVLMLEPQKGAPDWLLLHSTGPGNLRARRSRPPSFAPLDFDDRVLAVWRERTGGYDIELRLPLRLVGSGLGVGIVDVDGGGGLLSVELAATWDASRNAPGAFIHAREELSAALAPFAASGDRFRVIDRDGWVLSDTGSVDIDRRRSGSASGSLAEDVFRFVLRRDDPPYDEAESPMGRIEDARLLDVLNGEPRTVWYRGADEQAAIVSAASPIAARGEVVGAVFVDQVSDAILSATNQALMRLMSFSVVATLAVVVGMLGFATVLSIRVTRLARAAETALGPKGEINPALPGRRARDEIGGLARSFAGVLERLREHTSYLRTLTSKLSHELRTPLAVVSTSLDNLEKELADAADSHVYLERLRGGAARLDAILASMSEATNMERAIEEATPERFDLGEVAESCCRAYDDVYPNHGFLYTNTAADTSITGSRDLVAQMLDKLADNAVSFSPAASTIEIAIADAGEDVELSVANPGSRLPDTMRSELFDSLVSVRAVKGDGPHLGLGLYIVGLIVDFHGGSVEADNLPEGGGVIFRVRFPRLA